ncbi:unnamed protein product, partial [marine sediment metagenome]
ANPLSSQRVIKGCKKCFRLFSQDNEKYKDLIQFSRRNRNCFQTRRECFRDDDCKECPIYIKESSPNVDNTN